MDEHPDFADLGTAAGEIVQTLRYARNALNHAHASGDPMPADVLPDLRQAHAELAALITELEAERA